MKTLWIDKGDPLMAEWTALRNRILREPLGLRITEADFEEEKDDRHLVGVIDGKVVGGLMVRTTVQPGGAWKIRQFAVDPECQGRGLGASLMKTAEVTAVEEGITEIVLNSREGVIGFYRKFGFQSEGDVFEEVGIPHRKMRKRL